MFGATSIKGFVVLFLFALFWRLKIVSLNLTSVLVSVSFFVRAASNESDGGRRT